MNTKWLHGVLAAALIVGASVRPAPAYQIAEVRGDFYYDAQGRCIGHRSAELPAGFERRPMSHKEKFQLMGLRLPERQTYLEPRMTFPKPARVDDRDGLMRDKVIVKFIEGMTVRLRNGRLQAAGAAMPQVDAILARYPEASLHRCFDVPEGVLEDNKETGELISGKELADLNNFYILVFDSPSQRGVDLANELLVLDIVETAYLQAKGEAPACPGDAAPVTPLWVNNQNYLNPAPDGLDSEYAWAYHAGGDGFGSSYWVADLEWGWCTNHEDLDFDATDVLNGLSGGSDVNHGTAVLGEFGSCANAYGMTGMSPDVTLKTCDFDSEISWAANIAEADFHLVSGEIMLLEIHILGPPSGLACPCNCAQFEYVPVEWDVASWNAIQTATANGIIVVEAAGNGSMNLDSAIYGGWFNPAHDSGAIIVGAGINNSHSPECFTDYGSRVNVHGYGDSVYSTGYGDWFNQAGCNQDYTSGFSGTSSASPMIVGACASLQGISKAKYGVTLTPAQMRETLPQGGTPQGAPLTKNIGPMPNLVNAINWIEPDVITSFTPAGWSFPAVPRAFNNSVAGSVPLQAGALPGNVNGTYWNWNQQNPSYSYVPTINNPTWRQNLDAWALWDCFDGNFAPGGWNWCGNVGPDFVKGGRHTVHTVADVYGAEDEWHEGNNEWARQYIWSPLVLATNAPATRSYDPPRLSPGSGPYFNAEGFQGSAAGPYWWAFAILPTDASTDHDIYLNVEAPLNIPQQGFGASVAASGAGGDVSDFVIVDLNTVPAGTYYASGINWSGTGNKVVEWDGDQGYLGANPGIFGPYTLGAGNIVGLHEIGLLAGITYGIQVEWLAGDSDYGLSVYNPATGYGSKWSTIPGGFADNVGPHQDEWVAVSHPTGDFHGIAVWKKDSDDLNQSLQYRLIVSQTPNLIAATPNGWYGPIVPRNTTDAAINNVPLPPTLNGNQTTTSFNFTTFNGGVGTAVGPWNTYLYTDDVAMWNAVSGNLAAGSFQMWLNTLQGFDPNSLVRGGRHHLRTRADQNGVVVEAFEGDNDFTDWFVWTPLALADNVPVLRNPGPVKDPLGWGPEYSCDGFSSTAFSFWTAVGVLPGAMTADYDVRMHPATLGSKDGFGFYLGWSGDAIDGNVDFAIVNYNVVGAVPDFAVLNWNASTDPFIVQRAEGNFLTSVASGVHSYGPWTLGGNDVLDLHEIFVPPPFVGVPIYISLAYDGGTANLGIKLHDGNLGYQDVFTWLRSSNSNPAGGDEHLTPISFGAPGYHGISVHKTNANDLGVTGTYRLVISTSNPATDAPQVEGSPSKFALSTPLPNPFTRETSVRFDVPADGGRATVAVYDLQGRKISTLSEGERPAGHHLLSWNGKDLHGEKVAAGIYFIRLETATFEDTKKITLLR
jgi:hypothetical protein